MNGNGTHRNGNGFANGQAKRLGFAQAAPESVLSTKSVNELLELFEATGDQAPFEEIVRRYAGMVYNVCYQVSRDSHEAEDATQAVFLTLAVRSKTAQKIQYLGPWLQRVAQRLSLDMKRSKKRRAAREVKHHDLNVSRWEENNGPHDLGMDELRGILRDEIDRLPAKYRMPLILHYFGGLKPEEMSKELGIKANTLGVRLHRARKMLGDNLQKKGIVVGGAMLGAALATLVPMYIQHTIASKTSAALALGSMGHSLVAAEVTAQVLGAMRVASRAAILGKIKAVTAAVAIGAAAVAGAGQLIRSIQGNGLEFRQLFDPSRWLSPLLDRFRAPVRLSDGGAALRLEQILNARLEMSEPMLAGATFITPQDRADRVFIPVEHDRVLASNVGWGPPQVQLHGGVTTAPLDASLPAPRVAPAAQLARYSAPSQAVRGEFRVQRPGEAIARVAQSTSSAVSAGERLDRAVGSFKLDGGLIDRRAITLDSRAQPLRSFHVASGRVRTEQLTVAETGEADFRQTGGSVEADTLTLAVAPSAVARYSLAGGELVAEQQTIGQAGLGVFNQTAGANTAGVIELGVEQPGLGQYNMAGGALDARSLDIGVRGAGTFSQTSGKVTIRGEGDTGGVRLAVHQGSRGAINLSGGTLQADKVFVGLQGDGTYTQVNGQTVTDKIVIGTGDNSDSRFLAINGTVVFDHSHVAVTTEPARSSRPATLDFSTTTAGAFTVAAANLHKSAIVVGLNGDAVFQLGNARNSARLSEGIDGSRTPLVIRASPGARGEVIGWGDVDVRGPLVNNGKLIADGFGQPRVLDLSSVASVSNTIENDLDGAYGLYARRNGQLRLPAIPVLRDGDYNWGESASDNVPDLVNSVRIGFEDVRSSGVAKLTLLSPDDATVTTQLGAPTETLFVGLWKFDRVHLEADSTRLLVRYDEQMVEHLGLPESALSLWTYDGAWRQLSLAETVLDTDLNLIGGEWAGRFEYFGVSVSALAGSSLVGEHDPFYIPGFDEPSQLRARSEAFIHEPRLVMNSLTSPDMPAVSSASGVPEPASAVVVGMGALLLAGRRRRAG